MSDKVYVGSRCSSLEVGEPYDPISRVTFWVDDEHYYTAGDDTGRTMEVENPWATQEMVNDVYQKLKGFVYKPFKATDCMIDPAAEPGDMVTIGGEYFMIGQMETVFDAKCASTISAPSGGEMDHEYPFVTKEERELKRRVKLGQKYYGTKISRREGLVIEKTDGETVTAKAVLNADELSFYDGQNQRVLFFDPATGTYKFMGVLNVNDKFVVDKQGNVKLAGNINMGEGKITWGDNGPVQYQFSANGTSGWHDTMAANDKYRRDSLDGGTTWGDPYQFKGEDGKDGVDGSDATVPKYITQTVIAKGVIEAPRINANVFSVYPSNENDTSGAFIMHAPVGGETPEVFKIAYNGTGGLAPTIKITSGGCAHVFWSCDAMLEMESDVYFAGIADFSRADVRGIQATFA